MNKFDKLASEIIATYKDLEEDLKEIVDITDINTSVENFYVCDLDSIANAYDDIIRDLPYYTILEDYCGRPIFYYVKNPKDKKALLLSKIQNIKNKDGNWFFEAYNENICGFAKTFKEALISTLSERFFVRDLFESRIKKIQENKLEIKALDFVKSNRSFSNLEEFFKELKLNGL